MVSVFENTLKAGFKYPGRLVTGANIFHTACA